MNKVKIITSIYSDLHGSELGGRTGRYHHYRLSLLSLLKMTDADFICYTSETEIDDLKTFFYETNNISMSQLTFIVFDLKNNKYANLINTYKDIESVKKSDRCFEIQYSKFAWYLNEDKSYDYYYWFDAGLSHCALIPNEYLTPVSYLAQFYESPLFNNVFLNNLIKFSENKFTLVSKENNRNYWERTVNPIHYKEYNNERHIIGGFFGGKRELWDLILPLFENLLESITTEDKQLYSEEQILCALYQNNKELFNTLEFDIWLHRDNFSSIYGYGENYLTENKSFYRILEELNKA